MTRDGLPDGDRRHGMNGYSNLGCRCPICREEWAWYNRERRAVRVQLLADGLIEVEHGKRSTYLNYGCRCQACTEAEAEAKARRACLERSAS